jgi:hypothetical protein
MFKQEKKWKIVTVLVIIFFILIIPMQLYSQNYDYEISQNGKNVSLVKRNEVFNIKMIFKKEKLYNLKGKTYDRKIKTKLSIPYDIIIVEGYEKNSEHDYSVNLIIPETSTNDTYYIEIISKYPVGLGVYLLRYTIKYPLLVSLTCIMIPFDLMQFFWSYELYTPEIFPAYKSQKKRNKKKHLIPININE